MKINFTPAIDDLYNIESDFDFAECIASSDRLMQQGETAQACQMRLDAAMEILEQIDDAPEDLELDMNNEDNHPIVELVCNCGLDHYHICDFEIAAVMFETVLQLDSDDHFDILTPLAYCYAAMGEHDALEDVKPLLKFSRVEFDFFDGFSKIIMGRTHSFSENTKTELNNPESELFNKIEHLITNFPAVLAALK